MINRHKPLKSKSNSSPWNNKKKTVVKILIVAFLITYVFHSQSQLVEIQETKKSQRTKKERTAEMAAITISPRVPILNSNGKDYSTPQAPSVMDADAMPKLRGVPKPTPTDSFKPRTSLHHLGDCKVDPAQKMTRLDAFDHYSISSDYYVNVGNNGTNQKNDGTKQKQQYAICEFQDGKHATHFAHAMQQLYGCWSYWQQDSLSTLAPILLIPPKGWHKIKKNAFVSGFLESLQATINLQIIMGEDQFLEAMSKTNNSRSSSLLYNADDSSPTVVKVHVKGGYILDHAQRLRDMVGTHYSLPPAHPTNHTNNCTTTSPRIAILNRHKVVGRSIVNVDSLQKQLQERLGLDYQLPVVYFDGLSFQKQIEFFASVDILISPHGAQLTGLPFMTDMDMNDDVDVDVDDGCRHINKKALLELFPKEYGIPDFYGSLAVHAGISYAYLYLSSGTLQEEMSSPNYGLLNRIHARATNLCPSPQIIVDFSGRLAESCGLFLLEAHCLIGAARNA